METWWCDHIENMLTHSVCSYQRMYIPATKNVSAFWDTACYLHARGTRLQVCNDHLDRPLKYKGGVFLGLCGHPFACTTLQRDDTNDDIYVYVLHRRQLTVEHGSVNKTTYLVRSGDTVKTTTWVWSRRTYLHVLNAIKPLLVARSGLLW